MAFADAGSISGLLVSTQRFYLLRVCSIRGRNPNKSAFWFGSCIARPHAMHHMAMVTTADLLSYYLFFTTLQYFQKTLLRMKHNMGR